MSEPSDLWLVGVVVPPVFLALGALGAWYWYRKMKSLLGERRGDVEGLRATRYEAPDAAAVAVAERVRMEEIKFIRGEEADWLGPRAVPFDEDAEAELSGSSAGSGTAQVTTSGNHGSSTSFPPTLDPDFLAAPAHRALRPKPSKTSFRSAPATIIGDKGQRLLSKARRPSSRGSHSLISGEDPDAAPPKPQRTQRRTKSFGTGEPIECTDGSDTGDAPGPKTRPWSSDLSPGAASGPSAAYFAHLAATSASHPTFPDTSPYAELSSTAQETRRSSRSLLTVRQRSANLSVGGSSTSSSNPASVLSLEPTIEQPKLDYLPPVFTSGPRLFFNSAFDFDPTTAPAGVDVLTRHTFGVPSITSSLQSKPQDHPLTPLASAFAPLSSVESPTSPLAQRRDNSFPHLTDQPYSSAEIYSDKLNGELDDFSPPSPNGTLGTFGVATRPELIDPTRLAKDKDDERRPLFGPREYEIGSVNPRHSHPYSKGLAWIHGAIDSRGSLPTHHEQRRLTLANPDMETTSLSDAGRWTDVGVALEDLAA